MALAYWILESVTDDKPGSKRSDEQRAELLKREEEAKEHPEESVTWDCLYESTMKRLGQ